MEDVLGYAGRHVVVTGAASGIGAATATILTTHPELQVDGRLCAITD
jgi:NADP-dependent 3-hydroxy acid dehydrogenase YdfG